MRLNLDLRTLAFLEVTSALILGVVMLVVWRASRTYPGFGRWTVGKFFTAAGFLLISLRGQIGDLFSIIIANIFLTFATVLIFEGIRQYRNKPPRDDWHYALVLLIPLTFPYFMYVQNNVNVRVTIVALCSMIILLRSAALLIRDVPRGLRASFWLTGATMIIYSAVLLFRAATALMMPPSDDLFAPDPIQAFVFTMTILAPLAWTFGFLMMTSERLALELRQAENDAHNLATTDFLTGINNRRHFFDVSSRQFARSRREGAPLAVILIDLDHFKNINDTFGHPIGDKVIQATVAACRSALRASDILARYGGEEFAILLPNTAASTGREVAERLRQALRTLEIPTEVSGARVTASFGVAVLKTEDTDIDMLMRRADAALYRAKQAGRDCVMT